MILNKKEIQELIEKKDLIKNYVSLEKQLTPNGFDLTVETISSFKQAGKIDFSNKERKLPETEIIQPVKEKKEDEYGWWELDHGAYKIKTNESFKMPLDLIAIAFPRSSLLRMGAFVSIGVWDAGFQGKAEFVLNVENRAGIKIKQNARIAQILFIKMKETDKGYTGIFKGL